MNRRKFLQTSIGTILGASVSPFFLQNAFSRPTKTVREFRLSASVAKVNLGQGPDFVAWTFNGQVPGPEIRVREGEVLRVVLKNDLPEGTTIHWHGVPVPNPMDGVPEVTQKPVMPGETFVYEFEAKPAGTFIYHSHMGYQLDQGLYGLLVIEPARLERSYDQEYSLLLEDWVMRDGGGVAKIMRRPPLGPQNRGWMDGGVMGGSAPPEGGESLLEPYYDGYAVNGRLYPAVEPIRVKKGDRVKLRLGNVSSATIYDLRLAGHTLLVTHTDGNPVRPKEVDMLRIGAGERYDVEFMANSPGRWLLAARDSGFGEDQLRVPVVYEGVRGGEPVLPDFPQDLRLNRYKDLQALNPEKGPGGTPNRYYREVLGWRTESPHWAINGEVYPHTENLSVAKGEWVHVEYFNHTPMPHPMHLHGHFFRVVNSSLPAELWIKKDTFVFDHLETVEVEFLADNPGRWFHHCHNLYHMVDGMANEVVYKS